MSLPAYNPCDDQATRLRRLIDEMSGAQAGAAIEAPSARRTAPAESKTFEDEPAASPGGSALRLVAVASGKGGVGKTSLCVNLSIALARLGRRVTLLDGDLGLANADVLCGVQTRWHLGHVLDGRRSVEEILVDAPGGFRLASGGGGVARLAGVRGEEQERLLTRVGALERETDYLLIDCGAGLGAQVRSFVCAADLAVIVATPEPTSMADAYALLKVCGQHASAEFAPTLVVNQARDRDQAVRVHRRIAAVSGRFLDLHVPMLGWIPHDERVREAVSRRRPFLLERPRTPASRRVAAAGAELCAWFDPAPRPRKRGLKRLLLGGRAGG